jgi:hypothetical protein
MPKLSCLHNMSNIMSISCQIFLNTSEVIRACCQPVREKRLGLVLCRQGGAWSGRRPGLKIAGLDQQLAFRPLRPHTHVHMRRGGD